jgi:hypothetical protein
MAAPFPALEREREETRGVGPPRARHALERFTETHPQQAFAMHTTKRFSRWVGVHDAAVVAHDNETCPCLLHGCFQAGGRIHCVSSHDTTWQILKTSHRA